ncbi:hypothetical protein Clacol_003574 [Clathrus columnatus]|uniref:Uncharacterized protein n=1 Tax=Clathrus columnatus TaxID=1419009 RepID=A0AAV5A6Q4_9AGAM|nr:hypothetical protein Clacol_003574 [Clathrus columnatus]
MSFIGPNRKTNTGRSRRIDSVATIASLTPSEFSAAVFPHSPSVNSDSWMSTLATKMSPGSKPPTSEEPYLFLPTENFSLHYHLQFNPTPSYQEAEFNCNCGTWEMFCLPPHLGGCGHRYVKDVLYCGRTIDETQPENALSKVCPGIDPSRSIKCAGYMMGLCPTCRRDQGVIQAYHKFMTPFFVQRGLTPLQTFDAEASVAAAWKAHRQAFSKWISEQRDKNILE